MTSQTSRPARRFSTAAFFTSFIVAAPAQAGNVFEIGAGWQDTGTVEGSLEWSPSIQGSRKDVPAYAGWRHLGASRIYWAPFARLNYTYFYSLGGGGNLLGVTLAPAGFGVYLTRPFSAVSPQARRGRWFATLELNLGSLELGGNATPSGPTDPGIPDPNAYRDMLRSEVQQGGVRFATVITQHYPLGEYQYAKLSAPLQFRAWNMVTQRVGVGFFFEVNAAMLEWNIGPDGKSTPAYGYHVSAGIATILF
jgi:hypothetical protein